jgi:hypothetical protein
MPRKVAEDKEELIEAVEAKGTLEVESKVTEPKEPLEPVVVEVLEAAPLTLTQPPEVNNPARFMGFQLGCAVRGLL